MSKGVASKPAYLDFLTVWKDAPPDIPILLGAKAEYASHGQRTRSPPIRELKQLTATPKISSRCLRQDNSLGLCERLFNSEIYLDVGSNRHRLVFRANGRLEPPVSYRLDCLFVQAVTQRALDLDLRGMTFLCDDQVEHDKS